jgi:hypothetical protein
MRGIGRCIITLGDQLGLRTLHPPEPTLFGHSEAASVVMDASRTVVGEMRYFPRELSAPGAKLSGVGETRSHTGITSTDRLFTPYCVWGSPVGYFMYAAPFFPEISVVFCQTIEDSE